MSEKVVTKESAYTALDAYLFTLKRLFLVEDKKYDLVIGDLNSGASLVRILEIACGAMGVGKQNALILPIFRAEKLGYELDHTF